MNTPLHKTRTSNIELCRIVAILLVVLTHSQFYTLGAPHALTGKTFTTITLEAVSIIGVNVFVMISGYFSIHLKLKSLLNLLYICLFCSIVVNVTDLWNGTFDASRLLFLSHSSWFVLDYLGLMLLSPILNLFAEQSTKKQHLFVLSLLLVYQTWFGWLPGNNAADFGHGSSILSFCILYLLMRFVRRCNIRLSRPQALVLYLASTLSIIALEIAEITFKTPLYAYDYCNPFVILSAFAVFHWFLSLKMNYHIVINRIAKSTLAILLLHNSHAFWPEIRTLFKGLPIDNTLLYLVELLPCVVFVALCCVIVDQFRLISYKLFEKKLLQLPPLVRLAGWLESAANGRRNR